MMEQMSRVHQEAHEATNYLLTEALFDFENGDIELARSRVLEAQRIIYDLLR
jgi:hypothetical protein